jgi:anti-sigma factor RsiW
MTYDDTASLLGAYALDAVTDAERRSVERAVAAEPTLQTELDDLLRTMAALDEDLAGPGEAPPPGVWRAISREIDAGAPVVPLRPASRARRWIPAVAGAAAVALVAVLGIQTFLQRSEIADLRNDPLAVAAEEAAARPGSATVTLSGDVTAEVVLGADGIGYVLAVDLPGLGADETYQLWAIVGERVISAGVLGADPGISPFQVSGTVAGFALTVERAGGVVSSEQQPVAIGLLEG